MGNFLNDKVVGCPRLASRLLDFNIAIIWGPLDLDGRVGLLFLLQLDVIAVFGRTPIHEGETGEPEYST